MLKIASGGMATVFLGTLEGALGFRQLVAIKRPHPHLLEDPSFRATLLREARLAAGIHHANVVDVRDVEVVGDAVQLVMDYIEGASLGDLVRARARDEARLPPGVAVRIVLDACAGLHAAHEATDDAGAPLGLVHRDVSPQNVLVGVDGVSRVTDFGIAKCIEAADTGTSRETLKGKAGYMAPEYVRGERVDRRADVFALGVVLWEALCGKRCFRGQSDAETLEHVLSSTVPPVSSVAPELAPLDAVVARALARDPAARFTTAEEMARALEQAAGPTGLIASATDVGRFVRETMADRLEERRRSLRDARHDSGSSAPVSSPPSAVPPRSAELSATVDERPRRRKRRTRTLLTVAAGVIVLGGTGVVVLAWRGGMSRSTAEAASVPASAPVPATASAPASAPTPAPASAPTLAPARTAKPSNPRAPVRLPPPNPYPTGP